MARIESGKGAVHCREMMGSVTHTSQRFDLLQSCRPFSPTWTPDSPRKILYAMLVTHVRSSFFFEPTVTNFSSHILARPTAKTTVKFSEIDYVIL